MLQFDFEFEVPGKGTHQARGEFREGLRLAILGPSGCGKSTFLRALSSLGPRGRGSIKWRGAELNQALLHEGVLGFAFQSSPLFPHLSVSQNLALPFQTLNGYKTFSESLRMEKVQAALARAGLQSLAERWPQDLSGGERKRISLLRAIIFGAPVLILDEPFSDLDSANRQLFKDWIQDVVRDHKGILIYVTHSRDDLSLANSEMNWPLSEKLLDFGSRG